jgi:hypothetical protein
MENTSKVLFEDDVPQWYLAVGNQKVGPLTASDVYQKVIAQEITWAHFVWSPGQSGWERICDIPTFQAAVPALPGGSNPPPTVADVTGKSKKLGSDSKSKKIPSGRAGSAKKPPASVPNPDDEKIWYLHYNDSQFGPFSKEEVDRSLAAGKVNGRVHAWTDGMKGWDRLERIKGFKVPESAPPLPPSSKSSPKSAKDAKKSEADSFVQEDLRTGIRSPMVAKILLASGDSVTTAICRDISVGGMQVLTDRIPGAVGARIKLNVTPATAPRAGTGKKDFEPFVAEGVIVRILEDGRGFSFRFEKLTDKAKRTIESYIQSTG